MDYKEIIKAVLFAYGDAMEISDIARIIKKDISDTENIILELIKIMDERNDGLRILSFNNKYQISTRPIYYEYINKLLNIEKPTALSNASFETLSIIAYKQPIIKSEIEKIRGVKSDGTINTLLDKKLIEEAGRLDCPGKPILYKTSDIFLRSFGIKDISELPELDKNKNSGGDIFE